jgi:hypothetical protein
MKIRSKFLCSAALVSTLALSSCSNGFFGSPQYLAVTISPRPTSVPAGSTVVFSTLVTNNLSLPTWDILDAADTAAAGTLTAVAGSSTSISYTAPAAPPIYNAAAGVAFTQGTVTVQANVNPPPLSTLPVAHDAVTFFITSPTISVGISPATVTVPLGGVQYFAAYAVGSANNALTWQISGVNSGSINTAGIYTAPTTLPLTGNTVTITVISQADPTKTASAVVTLQ